MGDESAESLFELLALDNHIDHSVLQKKLRTLKLIRELLLDGLLDHPRTSKADQCLRLGQDHVTQHGNAGRDAPEGRIGQQTDQRKLGLAQLGHRRGCLGHLHERKDPFLHAGATGRRHEHNGQAPFNGTIDGAADFLAYHGPHAPAHKSEIEDTERHSTAVHLALADHDGVFSPSLFLLSLDTFLVGFGVVKIEWIQRPQVGIPLLEGSEIHEKRDAFHHRNWKMVVALRADLAVSLDFLAVDDFTAVVALEPHSLGHLGPLRDIRLSTLFLLEPRHPRLLSPLNRPRRLDEFRSVLENSTAGSSAHAVSRSWERCISHYDSNSPRKTRYTIAQPSAILPTLANPCTARKSGRPSRKDHTTGRLSASPISIMPRIEPQPNTAMYISPSITLSADVTTSSSNAADPAK